MKRIPIVGVSQPINDALKKVTGQSVYVDDLRLPRMHHAVLVLSDVAHGLITSIDTSGADNYQGVIGVFTHENTPDTPYNGAAPFVNDHFVKQERLFSKQVRFVGDRIAMVVAKTPKIAQEAAKLIRWETEELPVIHNMDQARSDGAFAIHPGGNIIGTVDLSSGHKETFNEKKDRMFTQHISIPSYHHAALEPHGVLADCDENNQVTVYSPTQNIFSARMICADVLGLPESKVRVIQPTMGGSFGSKLEIILEPLVAYASLTLRCPVKLIMTRKQTISASRRSYAMEADLTAHIRKNQIIGFDMSVCVDAGAYVSSGNDFIWAMSAKPFRLYDFPYVSYRAMSVLTNRPVASAMRGYGSTQLITAIEIFMDSLAKDLGQNPWDLRMKYAMQEDAFDLRDEKKIGRAALKACLTSVRDNQSIPVGKRWEDDEHWYGSSMALGIHGNGMYPVHTDLTTMTLKMNMDGSVVLSTGTVDMGSGANTSFQMMVAEVLQLPLESVGVVHGDTQSCPYDLGCYASRSIFVAGGAAHGVAQLLKDKIIQVLHDDEFRQSLKTVMDYEGASITYEGKQYSYADIALSLFKDRQQDLFCCKTYTSQADPMSYAAHSASVAVDKKTNKVKLLSYHAAHDVGVPINPMGVEGQIEGAISMGAGMAIQEILLFDEQEKIMNDSLKRYPLLHATEMPAIRVDVVDNYEPTGPFGAKSIGEIAAVPVPAAIINAISIACDTQITELPYQAKVRI